MDTLKIVKVLKDENLIELRIEASSKYISVNQYCYLQDTDLEAIGNRIRDFSFSYMKECYVEFGRKQGNYTPAFSLRFLPLGTAERVKIEVDMEIDDNEERKHRCCFYIMSELGLITRFGDSIVALVTQDSNVAVLNRQNHFAGDVVKPECKDEVEQFTPLSYRTKAGIQTEEPSEDKETYESCGILKVNDFEFKLVANDIFRNYCDESEIIHCAILNNLDELNKMPQLLMIDELIILESETRDSGPCCCF